VPVPATFAIIPAGSEDLPLSFEMDIVRCPITSKQYTFPPIIRCGGEPAMNIALGSSATASMTSGPSSEDLYFASVHPDNPEMERLCQEVIDECRHLGDNIPIQFIHDVSAGGLSNALTELINDSGCVGNFELIIVLSDEPGMTSLDL
jgi:Phosphoribosylformylglycinamidine (FGAM) synthase, synthetase domain